MLKQPYVDGELAIDDPDWTFADEAGVHHRVQGPREFRHTLSTLLSGLVEQGFMLLGAWEGPSIGDVNAEPGSWEHFVAIAPPWLTFWAAYRPDVFASI